MTLAVVCGLTTLGAHAAGPQGPARSVSDGTLVRLDVFPVAADGRAVADLTAEDFDVREDNVPQALASVEHVVAVSEAGASAPGARARVVVIFVDTNHLDIDAARALSAPLARALDHATRPGDVVAVMTPEMSVRDVDFTPRGDSVEPVLARLREFAARDAARLRDPDLERFQSCFPEDGGPDCDEPAGPPGGRRTRAAGSYAGVAREMAARRREQRVMAALTDLTRTLDGIHDGRKAVLVVSGGWQLYRENPRLARLKPCDQPRQAGRRDTDRSQPAAPGGRPDADAPDRTICEADRRRLAELDVQYEFKRMADGANRANVSFYALDAGLLGGSRPPDAAGAAAPRTQGSAAALNTLADTTDGQVIDYAGLDAGLAGLMRDLSSYYLLGYRSTNTRADGGYRRVTVSVNRRGVTVRARPGYRAVTAGELERQFTRGAQAGQPVGAGAVAVQAAVAALAGLPARAPVRARVAYGPAGPGRVHIWAAAQIAVAISREGGWLGGGTVDASLTAPDNRVLAAAEGALGGGERAVLMDLGEIDAPRTPTTLRLRVQPRGEGSRLQAELALGPLGGPDDLGVPLLSRRGPTTAGRYLPAADPRFTRTERLRLELPRPAPPSQLAAALLDRTGAPLAVPVQTTTRTAGGVTWAVAELALAPLAHGDYVLRLSVDGHDAVTAIRIVP